MGLGASVKAISKIALILLMVISAIVGGVVSYAFTIAYYVKIPERTVLALTNIYVNPENVRSFNVTVLNPSYSPDDVNITRIALSLKKGTQLYEVVKTDPSIKNGLKLRKGESINITCLEVKKDDETLKFGEFASIFAGEAILVHVFAERTPAANMEVRLPYVKLEIAVDFNPTFSFKKFNITLHNSPLSESNLTISEIIVPGVTIEGMFPDLGTQPVSVARGKSARFSFNGSLHGVVKTVLRVYTMQGYVFRKEIEIKSVRAIVQGVTFNVDYLDHFNVTIYNLAESANHVNVARIECRLDNGTMLPPLKCGAVVVSPNSTRTFIFPWNWKEYRGRDITITAYFTQEFATEPFVAKTPSPIIVKALNSTFSLLDKGHFSITILNHASSLHTVNVTRFVVKRTGVVLPITNGLISPGYNKTFICAFDWALFLNNYSRNLELTVHVVVPQTSEGFTFDFSFSLPVAELIITAINHVVVGGTGYLNLTVRNMDYSLWNLTLSKVVVTVQGLLETSENVFPKGHMVVRVGGEAILLFTFDWQRYIGKSITVTVFTEELVEASITYTIL